MIGLHLYTEHVANMPCNFNPGVYWRGEDFAAGVFQNSLCRVGGWAGWNRETNVLTLGSVRAKAGIVLGGVAGYAIPVAPLVLPSVAVSVGTPWLRLSLIPTVRPYVTGGVHFSVEIPYK